MAVKKKPKRASQADVAIIMGSDSDLPVMKDAAKCLREFGVSYKMEVVSAHRTPEYMVEFALTARDKGFKVIIAGAGGSAHLPGMVASLTELPVIGVPVETKTLRGLDSLLSIVQMPKAVPVATVAVNNSYNAGLLAARILGVSGNANLMSKLTRYRKRLIVKIKAKKIRYP